MTEKKRCNFKDCCEKIALDLDFNYKTKVGTQCVTSSTTVPWSKRAKQKQNPEWIHTCSGICMDENVESAV